MVIKHSNNILKKKRLHTPDVCQFKWNRSFVAKSGIQKKKKICTCLVSLVKLTPFDCAKKKLNMNNSSQIYKRTTCKMKEKYGGHEMICRDASQMLKFKAISSDYEENNEINGMKDIKSTKIMQPLTCEMKEKIERNEMLLKYSSRIQESKIGAFESLIDYEQKEINFKNPTEMDPCAVKEDDEIINEFSSQMLDSVSFTTNATNESAEDEQSKNEFKQNDENKIINILKDFNKGKRTNAHFLSNIEPFDFANVTTQSSIGSDDGKEGHKDPLTLDTKIDSGNANLISEKWTTLAKDAENQLPSDNKRLKNYEGQKYYTYTEKWQEIMDKIKKTKDLCYLPKTDVIQEHLSGELSVNDKPILNIEENKIINLHKLNVDVEKPNVNNSPELLNVQKNAQHLNNSPELLNVQKNAQHLNHLNNSPELLNVQKNAKHLKNWILDNLDKLTRKKSCETITPNNVHINSTTRSNRNWRESAINIDKPEYIQNRHARHGSIWRREQRSKDFKRYHNNMRNLNFALHTKNLRRLQKFSKILKHFIVIYEEYELSKHEYDLVILKSLKNIKKGYEFLENEYFFKYYVQDYDLIVEEKKNFFRNKPLYEFLIDFENIVTIIQPHLRAQLDGLPLEPYQIVNVEKYTYKMEKYLKNNVYIVNWDTFHGRVPYIVDGRIVGTMQPNHPFIYELKKNFALQECFNSPSASCLPMPPKKWLKDLKNSNDKLL